jgi:hypothetical protein
MHSFQCSLTCKYNPKSPHLLREPKILECGNTLCLECLVKHQTSNGEFKCNFDSCKKYHKIDELVRLPNNRDADAIFNKNLDLITRSLHEKIQKAHKAAKSKTKTNNT